MSIIAHHHVKRLGHYIAQWAWVVIAHTHVGVSSLSLAHTHVKGVGSHRKWRGGGKQVSCCSRAREGRGSILVHRAGQTRKGRRRCHVFLPHAGRAGGGDIHAPAVLSTITAGCWARKFGCVSLVSPQSH